MYNLLPVWRELGFVDAVSTSSLEFSPELKQIEIDFAGE